MTARARESLLKHAAERQLTFLNAAPMRLASLSLSNDQAAEAKPESVRPSRRKAPGLQRGQEVGQAEERVLISEILIQDKDGQELADPELNSTAWEALKACKPNFALTTSEVQADVHRIIDTGFFASCMPSAEDTRDGVRLIFKVGCISKLSLVIWCCIVADLAQLMYHQQMYIFLVRVCCFRSHAMTATYLALGYLYKRDLNSPSRRISGAKIFESFACRIFMDFRKSVFWGRFLSSSRCFRCLGVVLFLSCAHVYMFCVCPPVYDEF